LPLCEERKMEIDHILLPAGPMARRLRVPVKWLVAEAEAGRVPALRTGRNFLFNSEVVERVLLERAGRGDVPRGARRRAVVKPIADAKDTSDGEAGA
jgi:hypothetical protein